MEHKDEQVRKKGQVHVVRQGFRFNPEGRCKSNSDGHLDRQRSVKWKVFDVDWDENVISEHEETGDDTIPQACFKDTIIKNIIRDSKQIEVDLSDEVDNDRSIFENHAIIGRVVDPKFPRSSIRSWADVHWGKHVVIKFFPKGFFVAVFAEAEEKDRILCSQNWFLDSHPIYLQPWFPNFDPT
ncbi:hypothetical protein SUGI_0405710 [Cryptomeria japonica]|nr:hypothetical protein SUGI_0405710 [Cryptomeria japonica]